MKVVYHYAAGPGFAAELSALARHELDVVSCPEHDAGRFFALLAETEVLWHCLAPVDVRVLDAAPRLRLVQKIGVGVNTIDIDAAQRRGVAVCNMPGTNSRAVAEHTLGLMLAVMRQIARFDDDVRAGHGWQWAAARQDQLRELGGTRVGLVGFGAVPRILAPLLAAFGADVAYTARRPRADTPYPYLPLDALIARSDILSLHVPLTPETERLIDDQRLRALPAGAVLINTARGALVDEAALVEALDSGRLAGAGLDAFATEPLPPEHPLARLSNVVLTPHVAWLTRQTLARSLAVAVENCKRLRKGEPLLHRVV